MTVKKKQILGVTIDNRLLAFNNKLLAVASENYVKKLFKKYRFCQEYQTNLMVLKKGFFLTQ